MVSGDASYETQEDICQDFTGNSFPLLLLSTLRRTRMRMWEIVNEGHGNVS